MIDIDFVMVGSASKPFINLKKFKGVGKTSLIRTFIAGEENKEINIFSHKSTLGLDMFSRKITVNGTELNVTIWDTGGQEKYYSMASSYYKKADVLMMVYDVSESKTFDRNLKMKFLGMTDYWFDTIKENIQDEAKIVLVGNKIDLTREIDTESGKKLANIHQSLFYETSALTRERVKEAFYAVCEQWLNQFNESDGEKMKQSVRLEDIKWEKDDEKDKGCC